MCDRALPCTSCQGEYAKAGALHERRPAIEEKVPDPEHPDLAASFFNRALLLQEQVSATDGLLKVSVCAW